MASLSRPLLLAFVAAFTAVGASAIVLTELDREGHASCVPLPTPAMNAPPPNPQPLTDEQRDHITRIASTDPRVRAIASDSALEAPEVEVEPWYALGLSRLIGGAVVFPLTAAATLDGEWLAIGRGSADEDYSSSRYLATYRDVRSLHAFVDLERQAVVGISPGPPASLVGEQRFLDPKPLPPCDYD